MKNGSGRGFIGEPTRTLCTELAGDNTVISKEAWMRDGENVEEMDTGIFDHNPHDPNYHRFPKRRKTVSSATLKWNSNCSGALTAQLTV